MHQNHAIHETPIAIGKVSQHACSPLCLQPSYLCTASYNYILSVLYCYILVLSCSG